VIPNLLRFLFNLGGAVSMFAIAVCELGALAGVLVLPAALHMIWTAFSVFDVEIFGRVHALGLELEARNMRERGPEKAAARLDLAVAVLEEFSQEDRSADIERLQKQASLDREAAAARAR
jgi:hypothetical protein